ncbi:MAG: T9SS type A sorting domain-containing protein [Candidatus Delongbacteria bacterium]|nr:T9SS type A sorting domain-containing protein [Candidatus Delongbacteria bacterium]
MLHDSIKKLLLLITVILIPSVLFSQYKEDTIISKSGNEFRISKNSKTGAIHRAHGKFGNFFTFTNSSKKTLTHHNASEKANQFIDQFSDLLKIESSNLSFVKADTGNGCWYIKYQQVYNGIPIYSSSLGFTVESDGEVHLIGADCYPDIKVMSQATLKKENAIKIATDDFESEDGLKSKTVDNPTITILPVDNGESMEYHLVYLIILRSLNLDKQYAYFVDANSGNIILKENRIKNGDWNLHGSTTKMYYPVNHYDSPVSYEGLMANIKITDYYAYLEASGSSGSDGSYSINWSSGAGRKIGKFTMNGGFQNSYASIEDGADYTTTTNFFASSSGLLNIGFCTCETNLFYHVNQIHDYYSNTLGYSGMDYQLPIYANSNNPPQSWGTFIKISNYGGTNYAYASDVIYHEYTHCALYSIYGGWIGGSLQAQAMDEGFADYFACALTNDGSCGESIGGNRNLSNNYQFGSYPDSTECHAFGQVIGGACWDLRNMGGNYSATQIDYYILQALMRQPQATNFSDFAENLRMTRPLCDFVNMMETAFEDNHNIPVADECITPLPKNSHQNETVSLNLTINSYPNPSNGQVNIVFSNQRSGMINADIYNIMGEKVKDLFESYYDSGNHSLTWDCKDNQNKPVQSGIYFVRISNHEGNISKRIVLIK